MQNKNRKIIVYSHDTFGLGNIRRMLAITEHLLNSIPGLSILLISGSPMIHSFRLPKSRFDYLKLPCIGRTVNGDYIAKKLGTNFDELVAVRSQIIQAAVANFKPDVMIVDKKPRGISNELQPTLELIRDSLPATEVVLLLRDILDAPEVTRHIWLKNRYFNSIERYYRAILVMGSQRVFDVCKEYNFPEQIAKKVKFCGYINRNHISSNAIAPILFTDSDKPRILVTVGGGEDGYLPLKHFITGLAQSNREAAFSTLIVTGPEMSQRHREEILNDAKSLRHLKVVEFTPDLAAYMQAADLIVSMAGYNTIVEILALHKRSIIIPRVQPVQEQLIRAQHMDQLGLLKCIHPDALTPEFLMQEVSVQLKLGRQQSKAVDIINFDGLNTVSRSIASLLLEGDKEEIYDPQQRHALNTFKLGNTPMEGACSVFS